MLKSYRQVETFIRPGEIIDSTAELPSKFGITSFGNSFVVPKHLSKIIITDETSYGVTERCFLRCESKVFLIRTKVITKRSSYVFINKKGVNEFLIHCKAHPVRLTKDVVFETVLSTQDYLTRDYISMLMIEGEFRYSELDNVGSSLFLTMNSLDLNDPDMMQEYIDCINCDFDLYSKFILKEDIKEEALSTYLSDLGNIFDDSVACCEEMINSSEQALPMVVDLWCNPFIPANFRLDELTILGMNGDMSITDIKRHTGGVRNISRDKHVKTVNKFSFGSLMWLAKIIESPIIQFSFRYILPKYDTDLLFYEAYGDSDALASLSDIMESGKRVLKNFFRNSNEVTITKTEDEELIFEAKNNNTEVVVIDLVLVSVIDNALIRDIKE